MIHALARLTALASVAALGAGCAALPDRPEDVVDGERVAAIDRTARSQGNQVIWLRYPTRPSEEPAVIVTVTTTISRRMPEVVEVQVTVPIEGRLIKLPGVKAIRTRTGEAESYIEVTLAGVSAAAAADAVRAALASVQPQLPAEASAPLVGTIAAPRLRASERS